MTQIIFDASLCDLCGVCAQKCPFGAIDMETDGPRLNAACKNCGVCLKCCPKQAVIKREIRAEQADLSDWRDILVVAEASRGRLHPISLELMGKALELAGPAGWRVKAVLAGSDPAESAEVLCRYGADEVYVYDDPALSFFRADAYAACAEDAIRAMMPSVVLVGATSAGRSLAPRLAARFRTGLTADCTRLEMRGADLVQIRPAFGGNIMAQIVTLHTRPQFATVRYKVMNAPSGPAAVSGSIVRRAVPKAVYESPVRFISAVPVPPAAGIADAETLVVGGRGLQKESDLELIRRLASKLGGEWAVSRPLVEKGWAPASRQIGLSGRTVKPRLLIACGVSGAIQFTACMERSEHIIAVNTDPGAPIFNVAHIAVTGDLYRVIPELLEAGHDHL